MIKADLTDLGLYQLELEKKISSSTVINYVSCIESFLKKDPDLSSINDYNNYLLERVYKKRSYYYYYAIKSFIEYKIKDRALRKTLIDNLIKPKNSQPVKNVMYITPGQREIILQNLSSDKNKLIFKIISQTGARIGDILRLKRNSISYEKHNDIITMRLNIVGKGGRLVTKWIYDKQLQEEILDFISNKFLDPDYYFLEPYKNNTCRARLSDIDSVIRVNYFRIWIELKEALKKSGLDPKAIATHDFRRSISQDIYFYKDMGKDLQFLQRFLGHSRLETTARYVRTAGLDNKQISYNLAKKYGKIDKK